MGPRLRQAAATLAVLAAIGAGRAQGQPDNGGGDTGVALEPVEVSGRRALEERFFAPGSLVVVDRRDIERLGAFSVADVLRQLPGVVVNTAADGSVEIRMRGMERSATQLLVDGQRSSSGRGQLPLDQLPPEMVERIEVVRSPSAEYSGATGGTINIVLRQATVKRETSIRITDITSRGRHAGNLFASRTGPLGAATLPAADAAPEAPWAYFVAAAVSGWLPGADARSTVTAGSTSAETEAASRYRRREPSLVVRLNGRLGRDDQLALRSTFSNSRLGGHLDTTTATTGPAGTFTSTSREDQQQHRDFVQAGADWTHRLAGSKVETTLAGSQLREDIDRIGRALAGAAASTSTFVDRRGEDAWNLKTKLSGTEAPLLWMGGAEFERRDLAVDTVTGTEAFGAVARLDRRVLWGQNEWALGGRGTFTAGLRGESVRIETQARGLAPVTRHIPMLQPSVHVRMPIDDMTQWRANLARTTRNPRVWDLVDRTQPSNGTNSLVNPDTAGNPALRPEKSWALDTGLERRLPQDGHAGANLFVRRVSDAIGPLVTQVGDRWLEQRANAGDATVWGLELDARTGLARLGLPRDWTLSANMSLLQSRMTSGPNQGERIPGQPRYSASFNLAKPIRRSGGLFGGVTLNMTGAADLNTSPGRTGRDRARALLDTHLGAVVAGLGYWRVGLQNIGDAKYARDRRSVDPAGNIVSSSGALTFSPRAYLAVGTQF